MYIYTPAIDISPIDIIYIYILLYIIKIIYYDRN